MKRKWKPTPIVVEEVQSDKGLFLDIFEKYVLLVAKVINNNNMRPNTFIISNHRLVGQYNLLIRVKRQLHRMESYRFYKIYYKGGYLIMQSQFQHNYLIVYKLYLRSLTQLLAIKILSYRSAYVGTKKREMVRTCYLWNLYFLYKIRWFRVMNQFGTLNETTKGWYLSTTVQELGGLELIAGYHYLVHKLLHEFHNVKGYKVHFQWLNLRPYSWVPLQINLRRLWTDRKFEDYQMWKYWKLDGKNHILQYQILCHLPLTKGILQRQFIRFSLRWLKTFLMRMWKHPVLFDYTYLRAMRLLIRYGYRRSIPLKIFQKKTFIWQADPMGIRIRHILDSFVEVKVGSRGFFTEQLIEKHWKESLLSKTRVGKMLRCDWMYRPAIKILEVLYYRWLRKF